MKIIIQSIHFDATYKLQEFITDKLRRLEKIYSRITWAEAYLWLDEDHENNKIVEIGMQYPLMNYLPLKKPILVKT